ncbi:hypothetical protein C8J36_101123 [Rhizobium sp. PP-F2F-G48]|uniref:hypothetical protein n=1 Tax=Rhizobium sp. PP-F2F-G48 TaxID=2135651 RepID=UPI0010D7D8A5|nr:hypothetical protein [Rhizobium sp. PP-F2F-G48]TCM58224.1 hypothetical protein C8J36_101123 [Rhizobium sp. PP-F2F-G48]
MPLTYENKGLFVNTLLLDCLSPPFISLKLLILLLILLSPERLVSSLKTVIDNNSK